MGNLRKDAKDLLIGNDGSENEPKDFKTELQESIKSGVVTKSDGTLLVTARINSDKLGEKIEKKQIDDVKKIKDNELYDSAEEEQEAIKKKEAKKREEEKRRKQKEAEFAKKSNEVSKDKSKTQSLDDAKTRKRERKLKNG